MSIRLPRLILTSVVRGSRQGESHGGVYALDFETQTGRQRLDWNTVDIDFEGRGADRGLRGIAPDAVIRRLEQARDAQQEGVAIAAEMVGEVAAIPGVSGVHLIATRNLAAIPAVLAAAGIARQVV